MSKKIYLTSALVGALALSGTALATAGAMDSHPAPAPAAQTVSASTNTQEDNAFSDNARIVNGREISAIVDGMVKPNQQIIIGARCPGNVTHAFLTTTFDQNVDMFPSADSGYLVGTITAPNQITAGPDQGYHTFTITCDDGVSETFRFPDDGNSQSMRPVIFN